MYKNRKNSALYIIRYEMFSEVRIFATKNLQKYMSAANFKNADFSHQRALKITVRLNYKKVLNMNKTKMATLHNILYDIKCFVRRESTAT